MRQPFSSIWRQIVSCFLAGVFAVLPLVITVAVVLWVAGFLSQIVGPDTYLGMGLQKLGLSFGFDSAVARYTIGWITVLGVIFLLGIVAQAGAKKYVRGILDGVLLRVPLMGGIYGTAKQLVEMLDKKDKADLQGMGVVYCTFGRETGAVFLALMPTPERFTIDGRDYHVVIIPTAPVPVGGGLIFVPVEGVKPAGVSVDSLMSIYVSMGVTAKQFMTVAAA